MADQSAIIEAVDEAREKIAELDERTMMEVVGVAQAAGALRKALDRLDAHLADRQYTEASQLGYGELASEFIFVQRTLAGLQAVQHEKEALISELAMQSKATSFEDVEPLVNDRMNSTKPRQEQD